MTTLSDQDLLLAYARDGSHDAFTTLVRRHVHLVHSAAMRQARGDASLADDITQAVFVILTRRAGSIPGRATLPGWLIRTTRYAALAALKSQSRRRRHEQKAAVMTAESAPAPDESTDLSSLIDDAIARLPAHYRAAVTLRYLQNKSIEEVSATLGISEPNARKRIRRALEKLCARFSRKGITTPADAIADFLAGQSTHVAPTALVATLAAPSFHATPAAASLAKVVAAVEAKFILLTSAGAIALAVGVTLPVVRHFRDPDVIPARSAIAAPAVLTPPPHLPTTPLTWGIGRFLGNSSNFRDRDVPGYHIGHSPDPARGPVPACVIRSVTPNPTQASVEINLDAAHRVGHRFRLTFWAKTVNARDGASFKLVFNLPGVNGPAAVADTADHPIRGTTDWQPCYLFIDLPPQPAGRFNLSATLHGPGELWIHDYAIESVELHPTSQPITTPDPSAIPSPQRYSGPSPARI